MKHVIGALIFAAGAAIGSLATLQLVKEKYRTKYKKIADDEIESVKAAFEKTRSEVIAKQQEKADKAKDKPDISEYAKKLKKKGYTPYSDSEIMDEDDEEEDNGDPGPEPEPMFGDEDAKPYVISKENFGDMDDYDKLEFTYFSDHIVADDDDRILEDVEGSIGFEALAEFAKNPDEDVIYVQNDRLKTYYEVVRDERTYEDLLRSKPYLREV